MLFSSDASLNALDLMHNNSHQQRNPHKARCAGGSSLFFRDRFLTLRDEIQYLPIEIECLCLVHPHSIVGCLKTCGLVPFELAQ